MSEEKTNIDNEITITVDPEKINNELVKQNITDQALAEMKQNFMILTIGGLDDKEGYKKVEEARKLCKNTRILTTKICKKGREAATLEQKAWIAKEKEVVDQISEVEVYLEEQVKVIDDEKEKIKQQKEKEEQERLQTRISKLNACGMSYNGVEYSLGSPESTISAIQVKLLDDFSFNTFFAKVETEAKIIADKKAEEEIIAQKKAADLAEQEEKLKQERAKFEAEQAEFAKKEKEAKDKAEADAKKVAEQQAALEAERKKEIELRVKQRASIMHGLGMSFTGDKFLFHDITVDLKIVEDNSAEDFQKVIDNVTIRIATKKAELEKERQAEIEKKAQEKAAADKIAADKAAADKAEADAKEAALKPDREKIIILSTYIKDAKFPELTTDAGKAKLEEIKVQFVKFGEYLDKAAEGLK